MLLLLLIAIFTIWYLVSYLPKQQTLAHQRELERIETQKQKEIEVIQARNKANADEAYLKAREEYRRECETYFKDNTNTAVELINKNCGNDLNCANQTYSSLVGDGGKESFIQNCIAKKIEQYQ